MAKTRSNKTYNANPGMMQIDKDLDAIDGVADDKSELFTQLKHAYSLYSMGADYDSDKGYGYRLITLIYKEGIEKGYTKEDMWNIEKKAAAQSNWGKTQYITDMSYSNSKQPFSMKAFTR